LSRRTGYPHVNSSLAEESVSVSRPGLVQPVGCGQVMSTGVGIVLVAAGAIVRFAVPATFINGLNPRVAGATVIGSDVSTGTSRPREGRRRRDRESVRTRRRLRWA
jgi:hypothetical protein